MLRHEGGDASGNFEGSTRERRGSRRVLRKKKLTRSYLGAWRIVPVRISKIRPAGGWFEGRTFRSGGYSWGRAVDESRMRSPGRPARETAAVEILGGPSLKGTAFASYQRASSRRCCGNDPSFLLRERSYLGAVNAVVVQGGKASLENGANQTQGLRE